ncbi:hypothetical protein BSK63_07285 [Paenibacillus odorifer]|uniref:DUF2304 domain-containing protein n=1 Tax=unclassified Paenibacillus TaxID=185978 RepID=UPI00096EA35E|nr:hypothetical protein BSK63_07285 [Paenibacillus odorifer]OME42692.1 hypothetical protein BSK46_02510 [Paenibacillus odorifer]HBJ01607.1 DUF2304 domain-containing protein [Lysinibacillus sp.]
MFPFKLQMFLILLSVFFLFLLINMIKKYELQLKYALLWITMVVLMLIIALVPSIAFYFTNLFGFQEPSNFIFLLGILCSLVIIFSLSISLSNLSHKMRQISQEVGMIKRSIKELEENKLEYKE